MIVGQNSEFRQNKLTSATYLLRKGYVFPLIYFENVIIWKTFINTHMTYGAGIWSIISEKVQFYADHFRSSVFIKTYLMISTNSDLKESIVP